MAFETGIASGPTDLWDKLTEFLTTNADLVVVGEEWVQVQSFTISADTEEIVLRGPGGGTDEIYVGLRRYLAVDTDASRISLFGMSGILDTAMDITQNLNCSPETRIFMDVGSMRYWFVASGRRFMMVVNMSTVYQAAYAGFFLPYTNPLTYPYPMFVGGSAATFSGTGVVTSWRSASDYHANFPFAPYNTGASIDQATNGYMLDPSGAWLGCAASQNAPISIAPSNFNPADPDTAARWHIAPTSDNASDSWGYSSIRARLTQSYGGVMTLIPMTLHQTVPSIQNFGILDGVYVVPGVNNAVENTIEIDSVDYLVVQNVFRTTTGSYWAMGLE